MFEHAKRRAGVSNSNLSTTIDKVTAETTLRTGHYPLVGIFSKAILLIDLRGKVIPDVAVGVDGVFDQNWECRETC